jgi:hypothetical protein
MSTTDGVYATAISVTDYYPFGLEMGEEPSKSALTRGMGRGDRS